MLTPEQVRKLRAKLTEGNRQLVTMFSALADPGRFGIFRLLIGQADLCVTDVANIFNISVAAASQQLKVLELSGLVNRTRMGQMICYEVKNDDPLVKTIIKYVLSA